MTEAKLKEAAKAKLTETSDPVEKLRSFCLTQGYSGILSLGKLFRRMDKDKNWTLSRDELSQGVSQFGLDLTDDDITKLFSSFEKDGQSGINYEEFLDSIRPEMSGPRKEAVDAAFKKIDKSGDGVVTLEDLKGVYHAKDHPKVIKGEATEDEILKKFLSLFESNSSVDGKLTKQEFYDYYGALSKAIDDDEYFTSVVKMCWGLK